jgi:hypothetical protein
MSVVAAQLAPLEARKPSHGQSADGFKQLNSKLFLKPVAAFRWAGHNALCHRTVRMASDKVRSSDLGSKV